MNAEQKAAVEYMGRIADDADFPAVILSPSDAKQILSLITSLEADGKLLQRIAYLSYHRRDENLTYPERQELGWLLRKFKADCDKSWPDGIETPWPEAVAAIKGTV